MSTDGPDTTPATRSERKVATRATPPAASAAPSHPGIVRPTRVAGIVRGTWSHNEFCYYREALGFYDEVLYINPSQVIYQSNPNTDTIEAFYKDYLLNELAMLYTFGYHTDTLILAHCLEQVGCPISDPYETLSRGSIGKLRDLFNCSSTGLTTPAYVLPSLNAVTELLGRLGDDDFPLVRKPFRGNKGRGIKLIGDRPALLRAGEQHFKRRQEPMLLEKFVDFQNEYRVYVVDGIPIDAYEKVRAQGELTANVHQGAHVRELPAPRQCELFAKIMPIVEAQLARGVFGLDLATTSNGGLHLIEINRTPGFAGLDRIGRGRFPRRVHQIISRRARNGVAPAGGPAREHVVTLLGDTNPGDSYHERRGRRDRSHAFTSTGLPGSYRAFEAMLAASDFTLANLEVCLTERRVSALDGIKPYLDYADGAATTAMLRALGVNAVSLANNHAMDFGAGGLADTLGYLGAAGIAGFGAGADSAAAAEIIVHQIPGPGAPRELIFVAGFEYRKNHLDWAYYADPAHAGVNMWSRKQAAEQIAAIRRRHPKAFIVAFPHWGSNYTYVSPRQQRLAIAIADAGADVVVGHGSHTLQEIGRYRGKFLVFGLGNFVYNSPGRFDSYDVLPFGLIGQLVFRAEAAAIRVGLKLYPIYSDNRKTDYQPNFIDRKDFEKIMKFYIPHKEKQWSLEEAMRAGQDDWGYYVAFGLGSI